MPRVPLGYQQLTGMSSATGLTVPNGARSVDLTIEVAGVRFRDDGTNPTATVGELLQPGVSSLSPLTYFGNLNKLRFIQAAAGAVLNAAFYKT
jgi:hypothetical protein